MRKVLSSTTVQTARQLATALVLGIAGVLAIAFGIGYATDTPLPVGPNNAAAAMAAGGNAEHVTLTPVCQDGYTEVELKAGETKKVDGNDFTFKDNLTAGRTHRTLAHLEIALNSTTEVRGVLLWSDSEFQKTSKFIVVLAGGSINQPVQPEIEKPITGATVCYHSVS